MKRMILPFFGDRRGATAIEYTIIAAIVSLAVVAGSGTITDALKFRFGALGDALENTPAEQTAGESGMVERSVSLKKVSDN